MFFFVNRRILLEKHLHAGGLTNLSSLRGIFIKNPLTLTCVIKTTMDLAVKKIELINWLTRQDEAMVKKIDALRKSSLEADYRSRMDEKLESKLIRSEADIRDGRTHSQEEVETYFKSKYAQ
jgi:hypothetical protein